MRGVKVLVSCGRHLSHLSNHSRAFHKIANPRTLHQKSQQYNLVASRMGSTDVSEVKWPAKKVRDTFFAYFVDQHNHTFGEETLTSFSYVLRWCLSSV